MPEGKETAWRPLSSRIELCSALACEGIRALLPVCLPSPVQVENSAGGHSLYVSPQLGAGHLGPVFVHGDCALGAEGLNPNRPSHGIYGNIGGSSLTGPER